MGGEEEEEKREEERKGERKEGGGERGVREETEEGEGDRFVWPQGLQGSRGWGRTLYHSWRTENMVIEG